MKIYRIEFRRTFVDRADIPADAVRRIEGYDGVVAVYVEEDGPPAFLIPTSDLMSCTLLDVQGPPAPSDEAQA